MVIDGYNLLVAITLLFMVIAILRYRKVGGHCIPNSGTHHLVSEQRDVETRAPPQHQMQAIPLQSPCLDMFVALVD